MTSSTQSPAPTTYLDAANQHVSDLYQALHAITKLISSTDPHSSLYGHLETTRSAIARQLNYV